MPALPFRAFLFNYGALPSQTRANYGDLQMIPDAHSEHPDITDEMWFEEDSMKMVLMNFCEGQSNLTGKTPLL